MEELLDFISEAMMANEPIAILTELGGKNQRVAVAPDGRSIGRLQDKWPINKQWLDSLFKSGVRAGVLRLQSPNNPGQKLVYQIISPKTRLIIFGAGHVGHSLAVAGAFVGYEVTVIDDRAEFASHSRFDGPRINILVSPFEDATKKVRIDAYSAIAIVTRGHQYDELCLRGVINSEARYIGMIGSKRRVLSIFAKLRESGVEDEKLGRVRAPIGLEICAKTPQEIAVSILAEIVHTMNCD